MKKEVREHVDNRSGGLCEYCGSNQGCERHHIIGGNGKRTQCETKESVIMLCYDHHRGQNGVHNGNSALDLHLKQKLEKIYIALGYSDEKIRYLMGGRRHL